MVSREGKDVEIIAVALRRVRETVLVPMERVGYEI